MFILVVKMLMSQIEYLNPVLALASDCSFLLIQTLGDSSDGSSATHMVGLD